MRPNGVVSVLPRGVARLAGLALGAILGLGSAISGCAPAPADESMLEPAPSSASPVRDDLPEWADALLGESPARGWRERSVRDDLVVLGGNGTVDVVEIDAIGREAIVAVERAWHVPWPRRVLVVAPADRAQLATVIGVPAERSAAAMAIRRPGLGSFVVLDPAAWAQATSAGRRALLIHETVHLAVESGDEPRPESRAAEPAWLREGFAQDVAYRAIGATPARIAPDLLARIARDGPPDRLPIASDFEGTGTAREDAYALAWLAIRTVRRLGGDDAPRRAQEARSLAPLGIDPDTVLRAWQSDLRAAAQVR